MPFERRRNREYSYKSVRIDGLPRKIYNGTGPAGRAHEAFERISRRQKQQARAAIREHEERFREGDRYWGEIWPWVRLLTATHLLLAGFYNHHGEWRQVMSEPRQRQHNGPDETPPEANSLRERMHALNTRANSGDTGALLELRALLDDHPEIWRQMGDVNKLSLIYWANLLSASDNFHREAVMRSVTEWKESLLDPDSSAIEIAIAESAASAKLHLAFAETHAGSDDSVPAAEHKSKRLDRARNRLNATLRQLALTQTARRNRRSPGSPSPVGAPRIYDAAGNASQAG